MWNDLTADLGIFLGAADDRKRTEVACETLNPKPYYCCCKNRARRGMLT